MAKKLKTGLIAFFLVMVMACAAVVTVLFTRHITVEDSSAKGKVQATAFSLDNAPVATYNLGRNALADETNKIYCYANYQLGWAEAIKAASAAYQADSESYVRVNLLFDWTATANASGFGSTPDDASYVACFNEGRILVPAGVNILLDLAGNSIDRNLSQTSGFANGQALYVNGGALTIIDSSNTQTSKITGGYNFVSGGTQYGGGVLIAGGGLLDMYDITITGNTVSGAIVYGGGVCVTNGVFNMYSGCISENTLTSSKPPIINTTQNTDKSLNYCDSYNYGGGVALYNEGGNNSVFNMYGGEIKNHTTALTGGGVAIYDASTDKNTYPVVNIDGGLIHHNEITLKTEQGGAAIALYGKGNVNMKSGEIYNNRVYASTSIATGFGGAIFVGGGARVSSTASYTMSGGSIHHNVIDGYYIYGGGALALRRNGTSATMTATITGGTIDWNVALTEGGGSINDLANGGAIYTSTNTTLTVDGDALFTNNRACTVDLYGQWPSQFKQPDEAVSIEAILQAFMAGDKASIEEYEKEHYITDYGTRGGAICANGTVNIKGGKIGDGTGSVEGKDWVSNGNRAWQGGGVYLPKGSLNMSGGSIAYNMAQGSAGVRCDANSTTTFSGTPVIKENVQMGIDGDLELASLDKSKKLQPENCTHWDAKKNVSPSNYALLGNDNRVPSVGTLKEGAELHLFAKKTFIEKGLGLTTNYSKYNSKTVTVAGTGEELTVYANPYNYFVSDNVYLDDDFTEQYIMVLQGGDYGGELGISQKRLVFSVEYQNGEIEYYLFGEKFKDTKVEGEGENEHIYLYPKYNYVEWEYSDTDTTRRPVEISAYFLTNDHTLEAITDDEGNAVSKQVDQEAGLYTLDIKINPLPTTTANTSFSVIVLSEPISQETAGISFSNPIPEGAYRYKDGGDHKPDIGVISYGDKVLVPYNEETGEGDYIIEYENTENAGTQTAAVVIKFMGNYTGEYRIFYDIAPSEDTSITTKVSWQVWEDGEDGEDGEWVDLTEDKYLSYFTFNGEDQNSKIRAKLTYVVTETDEPYGDEDPQTVYVKGYKATDDDGQNTSMHLTFADDDETTEFKNAGLYSIKIHGYANYQFDYNEIITVKMNQKPIKVSGEKISADTFSKNYIDESGTRLWTLLIKTDSGISTSTLLDQVTYLDPDGKDNGYGVKVTEGKLYDTYARYRGVGTSLALDLNRNYKFEDGTSLDDLLNYGEIISQTVWFTGSLNEVNVYTTTVKIKFDSNYGVNTGSEDDTENVLTISKTWYIVNMSNDLRNADDGETIQSLALNNWTFGVWDPNDKNSVQAYVFRPEHGNTVIYSYYLKDSAEVVRVAIVYSNERFSAVRRFYGVTTDANGKLVADLSKPLSTEATYLYTFNYENLIAGDYTLEVYVPQSEALTSSHRHWYEGDEMADDYGVVYYEFTYNFTFTIAPYEISSDYENDAHLTIEWPDDNTVAYTGEANNLVHPKLTLYGRKVLVEDVDYVLSSSSVNAGPAELVITSLRNVVCDFKIEEAYTIRQAENGWYDVPSIANWTYYSFDREINLLSGEPTFGIESMWFAIARDEKGLDIISGLENITLEKYGKMSVVSESVAKILKGLSAGYYYLCAHVTDSDNYSALNPQPIQFRVFQATNSWAVTPTVHEWITGRFDEVETDENGNEINRIDVSAVFGETHIKIVDDDGTVYYDSDNDINILNEAKPGRYTLTAYVDGSADYSALDTYTIIFNVFKKPGLPWWVTLLAVVGALAVAALIIFILWKEGVFRVITDKILVAIRTRVSVESTLASVRAAKMAEEGKKSVADAKRRERLEAAREKQRSMTPEERAAQLEAKAQANVARAEKLRAQSEADLAKAEKMRKSAPAEEKGEATSDAQSEAAATENPETPTEE